MEAAPLLFVLSLLLVVAGFAGTVLPGVPGTPLVFAGLFLAAWAEGFTKVGWFPLLLAGLLAATASAVDLLAAGLGARRVGASRLAIAGAAVGTVVGLFFGLPGLLAGPFAGALVGEWVARRDLPRAGKVGVATWLGFAVGTIVKLALAVAMVGVFAVAYLL